MSSRITTAMTGRVPTFVACTTYSSVAPASAGPPPTTETLFVMRISCRLPTTTTVGSGPVAGLPSPSVKRSGSSAVSTTAWFAITVPGGVPSLTRRSNVTTAVWPGMTVPAAGAATSSRRRPR